MGEISKNRRGSLNYLAATVLTGKAAILAAVALVVPHVACGGEFWHGNGDGYWETNSGTGDNWETGSSNGYFFNKTAYGTKTVKFKSKVSTGSQVSIEGTNCTTDEDPIVFLADADEYGFTTTSNLRAGDYKLGNLWIKRGTFQCASLMAGNANNTGSLPLKIGGGDGKATVTATSDVKINKGTVLVATGRLSMQRISASGKPAIFMALC